MQRPWKIAAGLLTAAALGFALVQADGRQAVAAASPASASTTPTITVTGSGSVSVVPDEATVNLGVTAQAQDAAAAMSQDSQRMATLVAALAQAGVATRDIRTSGLDLSPQYQNGPGVPSGKIVGFTATNTVEATVHDTAQLGTIIDAALRAGANDIQGVDFAVSNPAAARRQAYQAAVADAQASAAAIASAAGLQIVGIQSISEASTCCVGPVFAAAAAPAATPVFGGQQTEQVSLQVVFDVTR